MSSDLTFENAWRGDDGLSLRFKERLILAMEETIMVAEAEGGRIGFEEIAGVTKNWSKWMDVDDATYLAQDLIAFVESCSAEGK